jgi:hypothetical protein
MDQRRELAKGERMIEQAMQFYRLSRRELDVNAAAVGLETGLFASLLMWAPPGIADRWVAGARRLGHLPQREK